MQVQGSKVSKDIWIFCYLHRIHLFSRLHCTHSKTITFKVGLCIQASNQRTVLVQKNHLRSVCAQGCNSEKKCLLNIKRSGQKPHKTMGSFQDDDHHGFCFISFFYLISYSLFIFFSQVMANEASGLQLAMVSVLYGWMKLVFYCTFPNSFNLCD